MLTLAAIALVFPAAYRSLLGEAALKGLGTLTVFPISPAQPEPISR
jgi:hypothetical protein